MSQNVGDSARIQQLEAEDKRLRQAVAAKGGDDDVARQIVALEREIARHQQAIGKLQKKLQAPRQKTGRSVELSPEIQEIEAMRKWQEQRAKELRSKYPGWS
jgi:predicted RNase H-like nuclease (RuvC/YqgF family)